MRYTIDRRLSHEITEKTLQTLNHEILAALHWKKSNIHCTIAIHLDNSLPLGRGRVAHENGRHTIYIHPKPGNQNLVHTLRHEILHSVLKSRIRSKLDEYKIYLPVPKDYKKQTFRENLEEYIVRCVNASIISQGLGKDWLKKQIEREIEQGFSLMPYVITFYRDWKKKMAPFSRETFIALSHHLKNWNR